MRATVGVNTLWAAFARAMPSRATEDKRSCVTLFVTSAQLADPGDAPPVAGVSVQVVEPDDDRAGSVLVREKQGDMTWRP